MQRSCIILTGPTAVGKTSLGISLAQHFNTSIISADSRQCFRELNIGVAKPTADQLAAVKHYYINTHSIREEVSAAVFEAQALTAADEIFRESDVCIMVGGTGLYIKAFCEGMDDIPVIRPGIREEILSAYRDKGWPWLVGAMEEKDPLYLQEGEAANPQRMMRALEVVMSTGRSIISFRSGQKKQRPFNIVKVGFELPRPELYDRINTRVDEMMDAGLLEEAKELYPFRSLNALQTVGYQELFEHFDGRHSLERAIELIKQNTRNYAKRQMTWFKKDPAIHWLPPDLQTLQSYLGSLEELKQGPSKT